MQDGSGAKNCIFQAGLQLSKYSQSNSPRESFQIPNFPKCGQDNSFLGGPVLQTCSEITSGGQTRVQFAIFFNDFVRAEFPDLSYFQLKTECFLLSVTESCFVVVLEAVG